MALSTVIAGEGATAGTTSFNICDTTLANLPFSLPLLAYMRGNSVTYWRISGGSNTCVISPCEASGVDIAGAASFSLDSQWDMCEFFAPLSGSSWVPRPTSQADASAVSSALTTHAALTDAHAATGGVMGVTKTQTGITGKTFTDPIHKFTSGVAALWDDAGIAILKVVKVATSVNFFNIANASAGVDPYLEATGSDAAVSFNLKTKGAGVVKFNGTAAPTATSVAAGLATIQIHDAFPSTAGVLDPAAKAALDTIISSLTTAGIFAA